MLNKLSIILLGLFASTNVYVESAMSITEYKQKYDFVPHSVGSINEEKTLEGNFVNYHSGSYQVSVKTSTLSLSYDLSYNECFFVKKDGQLINVKDEIRTLFVNLPAEFTKQINFDFPGYIQFSRVNEKAQALGRLSYILKDTGHSYSIPFIWSPSECKILPTLEEKSGSAYGIRINKNGTIIGYDTKTIFKKVYLGKSKNEIEYPSLISVPVVWINDTIKQIFVYDEAGEETSYYNITIDDTDTIHIWADEENKQLLSSIHISELD